MENPGLIVKGLVLAIFLAALPAISNTHAATATPTAEQLLAAAVRARDVQSLLPSPGGWWNDQPEFNDRLNPAMGKTLVGYVISHVFGKPDSDPSNVDTAVDLYSNAPAATTEFASLLSSDRQSFGALVTGPAVGNRSRYLQHAAAHGNDAASTVRFQLSRYLVRITVAGKAAPVSTAVLVRLARTVTERLVWLDAGKLPNPPLPKIALKLPAADAAFGPILGSAGATSAWLVWRMQGSGYAVSRKLRALAQAGMGNQLGVFRVYGFASHPDNVVTVTLMPFANAASVSRYLAENRRESGWPAATDTKVIVNAPHGPDAGYSADFRDGRYEVSVTCWSPFQKTTPACAGAVRAMAQRVSSRL